MSDEFGPAYASVLLNDQALIEFGDRTAAQALAEGEDVRQIWYAICRSQQVPSERWHGLSKPTKK